MSRRIFKDIEEALEREVRRITFHDYRTVDRVVLRETYDPLTGELMEVPIEPSFYDSSADASHIQHPHFFVRLLKTREDIYTGRVVPQYGNWIQTNVTTSPKAYEIIVGGSDGVISAPGNEINTTIYNIRKVEPGYLIRLLNGNNKGTYIVDSINISNTGTHSIFLSSDITIPLPSLLFDTGSRVITFESPTDLNTVIVGDNFVDSALVSFPITAVDINNTSITIGGVGSPSLLTGGKITRTGDILLNSDPSLVRFIVMDPAQPVLGLGVCGASESNSSIQGTSPQVPIDAYYLVRIDSKHRETHVDILNRVWEEFNPPRTGLPIIVRSALSAEQKLTQDITTGGSPNVFVEDNSGFNVNDPIFIFDDFTPSKSSDGKFDRPFTSKVIGKISTNQLVLADVVPDTFIVTKCAKIVSNALYYLHMFHFVDHVTKDVEGAQYWVHEFTFWVQVWVDRQGDPKEYTTVTDIQTPIEDIEGNIIIEDN